MALNEVQSSAVPLEFSSDTGTTWKKLVCRISNGFKSDIGVNEEETDCGIATGLGAQKWNFDFSAVVNTAPAAGSGSPVTGAEISYEDMLAIHTNKTKIMVRQQNGSSGANFKMEGEGYVTSLSLDFAQNSVVKFSGSFKGVGALTIA